MFCNSRPEHWNFLQIAWDSIAGYIFRWRDVNITTYAQGRLLGRPARIQLGAGTRETVSNNGAVKGRYKAWKTWAPGEDLASALYCHPAGHDGKYEAL